MTYNPGTWTCDRCDQPVSEFEWVELETHAHKDSKYRAGWIAHYHQECWWAVSDALREVVEAHRSPLAALEPIPTVCHAEINRLRARHTDSAAGRPGILEEDLRKVLATFVPKVKYALPRAGITSLKQVSAMTDEEILALPGVGYKTLVLLRSAIAERAAQTEVER